MSRCAGWTAGFAAALGLSLVTASAQDQPARRSPKAQEDANALVREALHAEIDGRAAERTRLLRDAMQQAPDLPAVRWLSGYVRSSQGWEPVDSASQSLDRDSKRNAYRAMRNRAPDTLEGHLKLAAYCGRNGLKDEERAHLSRVVDLNPEHLDARQRLGFRKIADRWWSAEELEREQRRSEARTAGLEAWGSKVEAIAKNWNAASELRRKTARKELADIRDAAAVVALEQVLSNLSADAAWASVEKIATFHDPESTASLARHAVLAPWPEVRELAARQLKDRPEDEYIPLLLGSMSGPIESRTSFGRGIGGRLMYRHEFVREGQDARQLIVFDTAYRRIGTLGGDREDTLTRALVGMSGTIVEREQRRVAENELIAQINQRIASVLTTATGERLSPRPDECWQWWNDRNEIAAASGKTTQTSYDVREIEVYDRVPQLTVSGSPTWNIPRAAYECLIAGTLIHTTSGPLAVERIRIGDLVLAQHPRTGEIAFKPVLRTSIRPPETTVRIVTVSDPIVCTGGHPFWVAGSGWVKARSLKSGAELHTLSGPVRVSEVKEDDLAPTYNLVVADFHTYFVGPAKILSHDNTIRLPTTTVVPGLVEK